MFFDLIDLSERESMEKQGGKLSPYLERLKGESRGGRSGGNSTLCRCRIDSLKKKAYREERNWGEKESCFQLSINRGGEGGGI